jgi:1,4-dihydroxy-2-naphthoate octaprenyltransferase
MTMSQSSGARPAAEPTAWRKWLLAVRPKTLSISVVPVLVGTALAWGESGRIAWLPALAALWAALCIQAGTNLHNDAADFDRGTDTPERLGPKRVTAEGWLSSSVVRRAAAVCFGVAILAGTYLVWVGGWPILALGLLSVLMGYAYTGGPLPIAYSGLGELFVWLFFGLGAVLGSHYLQTSHFTWATVLVASAIGMLAAAVLVVNNYRDMDSDRRVGKHTLAVRLGRTGTQLEYGALLLGAFICLALASAELGRAAWLPWLVAPWAVVLLRRFLREPPGPVFNVLLAQTAQLQLAVGVLLSLGLLLGW